MSILATGLGEYEYSIEDTLRIYDAAYIFSLNLTFSKNEIIKEFLEEKRIRYFLVGKTGDIKIKKIIFSFYFFETLMVLVLSA